MSARRTATKRNSTKRTGAKKGGTSRKGKVTRINKHNNIMSNEILCVAALAGSALALVSLLGNEENAAQGMGAAGNLIRQVLLGLFGMGGYLLPVSLIIFSIYMLFNRTTIISPAKAYGAVILFFTSLSGAHILSFDPAARFNDYADYILSNYRSGAIGNGGFFGALFGNVFYQILGRAGSLIFLGALWLICAMVVTGRSFFEDIAVFFVWIRSAFSGDESDEAEHEEYEEYEEEAVPPPRSAVRVKKLPEERASRVNRKGKTGPKVYTLNEEKEDGSGLGEGAVRKKNSGDKVLLFGEEFKKSQNPEDQIAHPVVTEIKVRGLYEEEADSMPNKLPQAEEPCFEDETDGPDERPEERQMQEIYINTAPILPMEMPEPIAPIVSTPALPTSLVSATIGESADYVFPPIDFLNQNTNQGSASSKAQILENSRKLEETLKSFGVEARVIEVSKGPTVTRYELSPGPGVKVSRISGLADDLALNLAAVGIRIEAPIPGKSAVGIEVPNKEVLPVYLREVLEDDSFKRFPSNLAFALGKDIAGNPVVADIAKMPHLLIAGATGSGKSVCINTLITSIIYKAKPEEVKLLMVDPKVVELSVYNGIPHLLIPVVTDPKKAAGALNWAVREMLIRYDLFAQAAVRDLKGYNAHKAEAGEKDFLPQIVIIIDELADLMMAAPGEVEEAICRLAQMARAAGLHLIIATQRPSVDVITGLIKANVPSRLAFSVSSGTDSRTILDMVGAERLLGKGDMLFSPVGLGKPMRVQGAFISDKEVENIVSFVKRGTDQQYDQEMIDNITSAGSTGEIGGDVDEFFEEAVMFIIGKEKASASMLQRQFRIGYNRASRLIEDLEARGIVGPEDGSKPRKVLMTTIQWRAYKEGKDGS